MDLGSRERRRPFVESKISNNSLGVGGDSFSETFVYSSDGSNNSKAFPPCVVDDDSEEKNLVLRKKSSSSRHTKAIAKIIILIMFVIVLAGAFLVNWYMKSTRLIILSMANPNQEVVKIQENFLSYIELEQLQTCVANHSKLRAKRQPLNTKLFAGTKGFVLSFNDDGYEKFRTHPDYACFVEVFNRLRLPKMNAFVLNIVAFEQKYSVGIHLDNSVGILSRHIFVAHQTDVFYTSIASDMKGGELDVFNYTNNPSELNFAMPEKTIIPKENMLVRFRGDSYHRVRNYTSSSGVERTSLIVEQYKIDGEYYKWTTTFIEVGGDPNDHELRQIVRDLVKMVLFCFFVYSVYVMSSRGRLRRSNGREKSRRWRRRDCGSRSR